MYPRTIYEMTEDDFNKIIEACKPTAVMKIGNYTGTSPQENANRAWKELGEKMGFDYMTVRPIQDKGSRFFSAIPSETENQKKERLDREDKEKKRKRIKILEDEISEKQKELNEIKGAL